MTDSEKVEYVEKMEKEGKVVIFGIEGTMAFDLDLLIGQPLEGLLYDLNRSKEVVLTHVGNGNEKWVNDYAVCLVITELYNDLKKNVRKTREDTMSKQTEAYEKETGKKCYKWAFIDEGSGDSPVETDEFTEWKDRKFEEGYEKDAIIEELLDACKSVDENWRRDVASGNFLGDDEHHAWSMVQKAIESAAKSSRIARRPHTISHKEGGGKC